LIAALCISSRLSDLYLQQQGSQQQLRAVPCFQPRQKAETWADKWHWFLDVKALNALTWPNPFCLFHHTAKEKV